MKADLEKFREWRRRSVEKWQKNRMEKAARGEGKRVRPKKRSPSEYARIYGSRERVERIKAMRCTVPGCVRRPSENAHIENGGMGRKAGWETITPLCHQHHHQLDNGLGSVEAFDRKFGTNLRATAARLAEEIPA